MHKDDVPTVNQIKECHDGTYMDTLTALLLRAIYDRLMDSSEPHICDHGYIGASCGLCMRDRGR